MVKKGWITSFMQARAPNLLKINNIALGRDVRSELPTKIPKKSVIRLPLKIA